jgi:hypothetical protein
MLTHELALPTRERDAMPVLGAFAVLRKQARKLL